MPITVTCPGCSTTLKAPDAAAGKKVKCPKCTSAVPVPAAEAPVMEEDEVVEEAAAPPRRSGGAVSPRRREAEVEAGPDEPPPDWQSNRVTLAIIAIFLGGLGIHKFMLGITQPAVIMLVVWLVGVFCTVGLGAAAMSVIGIIEGVIYLTKTDAEFYRTYVVGKKPWF